MNHDKSVTTPVYGYRIGASGLLNEVSEFPEHSVPFALPKTVVRRLKVVEVTVKQSDAFSIARVVEDCGVNKVLSLRILP
jgi:hypothetical protein